MKKLIILLLIVQLAFTPVAADTEMVHVYINDVEISFLEYISNENVTKSELVLRADIVIDNQLDETFEIIQICVYPPGYLRMSSDVNSSLSFPTFDPCAWRMDQYDFPPGITTFETGEILTIFNQNVTTLPDGEYHLIYEFYEIDDPYRVYGNVLFHPVIIEVVDGQISLRGTYAQNNDENSNSGDVSIFNPLILMTTLLVVARYRIRKQK